MVNADEFCQYARFGQTMKIQKALRKRQVDVNVLNLFGESALSTATYHNQILCVEYLLANRADPKLRLLAGHTAIHVACRLGNVPILNMMLTIKTSDEEQERVHQEDKHIYHCLKIRDHSDLTPIDWAAAQESVSKRQKMFAYLDRRMPGVLDSRYDPQWFDTWAKSHPWVLNENSSNLLNEDQSSEITSLDTTPKSSTNYYERTPRPPLMGATITQYRNVFQTPLRPSRVPIEKSILPTTPKTSCKVTVTSTYEIPRAERKMTINGDRETNGKTSFTIENENPSTTNSTRDSFIHRARRVSVVPSIEFPPPPSDLDGDQYEDVTMNRRPSQNLLSNLVPSPTSPTSTDQSSQPSTHPIGSSFGFDIAADSRYPTTVHSSSDEDSSSTSNDDEYQQDPIDYLCQSTSTLGVNSPYSHGSYV